MGELRKAEHHQEDKRLMTLLNQGVLSHVGERRKAAEELLDLKRRFRAGDIGIASILMGITEIAGRLDPA